MAAEIPLNQAAFELAKYHMENGLIMHNRLAAPVLGAMGFALLGAGCIQAAPNKAKTTIPRKKTMPFKPQKAKDMFVYVGTYTGNGSKGIYVYRLNPDGKLGFTNQTAETQSPSFLALAPSGHTLYAGNEVWNPAEKPGAGVSAFAIDAKTGGLTALNFQSLGNAVPAYVSVSPNGKVLAVANYGGGSVASFPLSADGKLGEQAFFDQHTGSSVNADRQKEPHAHSVLFDASGHYAFSADLGVDKIYIIASIRRPENSRPTTRLSLLFIPGRGRDTSRCTSRTVSPSSSTSWIQRSAHSVSMLERVR